MRLRAQLLDPYTGVVESESCLKSLQRAGRAKFRGALNANSAFVNLLERNALKDVKALTNDDFIVVNTGVTAFTKWNADWLFTGGKFENFSIDDLTTVQDLYVRTEVSAEESLKVGGLRLNPMIGRQTKNVVTRAKVGLYQINQSMEDWADDLLTRLVSRREEKGSPLQPDEAHLEYEKNSEWVNDDSSLIARCLRETGALHLRSARVILISADVRLANQMANTCQVLVCLVHPTHYIQWCVEHSRGFQDEIPVEDFGPFLNKRGRNDPFRQIYVDTGSLAAFAVNLEHNEGIPRQLRRRNLISTGLSKEGRRMLTYTLSNLERVDDVPYRVYQPVEGHKRYRFGSGTLSLSPDARQKMGSRSSSWRIEQSSMRSRPLSTEWKTVADSSRGNIRSPRGMPGAWPTSPAPGR
jgi:hypothetical protein